MLPILAQNLVAVIILMLCVWAVSLARKDAGIVDVFWGLGFVLVAWLTFIRADGYVGRKVLVTTLTTAWAARLSLHIYLRNRGKGEDPRYGAMRTRHGTRFWWVSLFTVFLLQALLLWLVSLVIQAPQFSMKPAGFTFFDLAGTTIWAIGFLFEAVGDWQLKNFQRDPSNTGKLFTGGLWAYTRHPNYFGESVLWWGMFLIALATPQNVWVVISPLLITFLLLKVSGVVLLEKSMVSAHPDYQDYIRRTNAFVPWFPKREGEIR